MKTIDNSFKQLKTCIMPFSATSNLLKNIHFRHMPFCLANHELVHSLKQYTLALSRNRNLKQFNLSQEMCGVYIQVLFSDLNYILLVSFFKVIHVI